MVDGTVCAKNAWLRIAGDLQRERVRAWETEAFMGGYVNNVWSKDGMREVGNARLKRRISRLEE